MTTIALVDDDRNILTSVSILLESEGYQVKTYTDGAAALAAFNQGPPELAILDFISFGGVEDKLAGRDVDLPAAEIGGVHTMFDGGDDLFRRHGA